MSKLMPIPKGQKGWKVRATDIMIMTIMSRATQPKTGWDIYQKMTKIIKSPPNGDVLNKRMYSLKNDNRLEIVGHDSDGDPLYVLSVYPHD